MLQITPEPFEWEEDELAITVDELARKGARKMLMTALKAEVADYVDRHREERDEHGRALVVRNGKARPRKVTTGSGTVEVSAPRVNDKRVDEQGNRRRFTSRILPPYMRRSPKVAEVLPLLYLHGLSTGDFKQALPVLLGDDASGLSATAINRMTAEWEAEYKRFRKRDLSDREYVYVFVDGLHMNVRLEVDRLCMLIMVGVTEDGSKEVIAIEDGYRESKESWSTVLRDLRGRGMKPPVLAIGDGALGFWAAVRDIWPEALEQRDWFHKLGNLLDKLPRRLQPRAKQALHEVMYAETKEQAVEAVEAFASEYGARYPKVVASLRKDQDKLLTFFDFPAEHWQHLRTTNAIESTFGTVRHRQWATKGNGSRTKALVMTFKLMDMAQKRWRRISAPHLVKEVKAGARFIDGIKREVEAAA